MANAAGRLTITAVASGPMPPSGIISVATLNFSATSHGAATIAADVNGLSLASAIQVSGAALFGPATIPGKSAGGGVVVQRPPSIAVTLDAGPSPVTSGGQLVYDLHVTNNGGSTTHGVVLSVPLPSGTTVSAISAGGTSSGGVVQWNAGDIAAAATFEAFLSLNVTTPAGTTISGSPATATATDAPSVASSAVVVGVTAISTALKPGAILAAASNERGSEAIYDVTTGTPVLFSRVPSGGWIGSLLITPTGRLYTVTNAYGGAVFDVTAGGDLTNATPLARGLAIDLESLVRDAAGNLYTTSLDTTSIFKIAPSGQVTTLDPSFVAPAGLIVIGNLLYVSEGGTGSVKTIDLTTGTVATFATGFPTGVNLFSGQLIRNSQGHLFLLWGNHGTNLGLFDITAGGDFSAAVPVTAKNTFRTDVIQMAVDASDNIYFAGDGTGVVWRSTFSGGTYSPVAVFAPNVGDSEAMAIYPRPPLPLLALSTAASALQAISSFPLTYTLSYANNGGASAANVVLTATLPSGVSFVSATNGGTLSGNQVTWSLGTLAASASGTRSVTVNVTATAPATLASATCTLVAGDGTNASATLPPLAVLPPPHLTITVTPSAASLPSNSYMSYSIAVHNDGGTAATNLTINDDIPDFCCAPVAFTAASGNGAIGGTTVTWHVATLAPGATDVETLVVRGGSAGTTIHNPGGSVSADNLAAVTGPPVATPVTAASSLALTLAAGPSPVIPRSQVNVLVQYANTATTAANDVAIVAAIPADADLLSQTGSPTAANGTLTWTIPTLAAGASGSFRYSIRTNVQAGSRELLTATIAAAQQVLPSGGAPGILSVQPLPSFYVPGCTFVGDSFFDNGFEARPIYRLTSSPIALQFFASPPRTTWVGPFHVAPNGHLYTAIEGDTPGKPGLVYDITVGGDLSAASPLARNVGNFPQSMVSDEQGNLYVSVGDVGDPPQAIRKITPEGDVTQLPPLFQYPGGLSYDAGFLYVAEGGTGTVWKLDLQTFQKTAFVTGFPTGPSPSGQMVRNQQSRLLMLWGDPANRTPSGELGLFDITNGGSLSTLTPITAVHLFRIDVNQMALFPDNSILIASNGSLRLWRAPFANGQYGTTSQYFFNNFDNESVAIVPPLRLEVSAAASPAHVFSGESVTFTLTYTNHALTDLKNSVVVATVPNGTAFISATNGGIAQGSTITWRPGTVAAGASGTVLFTAAVTALEGATITLQTYTIGGDDALTASGTPLSVTVEQPLQVTAKPIPTLVTIGQSITFTLRYENRNATTATGVVVRATVPAGSTFLSASSGGSLAAGIVTWSAGTVAAGVAAEVSFTVRTDAVPSAILATYSVSSNEFGTRSGLPLTVPVLPLPFDLAVSGTATPNPVASGANLTYTITYSNGGGSTAPSVVLQDPIPAGTTFVSATGGSLVGNAVVWQLGAIPPDVGGTVLLTVAVSAAGGSTITNASYTIANATQTRTGTAIVTPVVAPPPPAPLAVSINASPNPVTAGELLTYQIAVTNSASVAADSVIVSDAIPAGTSFVGATGPATSDSDTVQWSLGTLAPGESITLGLTVRVTAAAGASIVNAGASATCAGRAPGASASVTTSVIDAPAILDFTIVAPSSVTSGEAIAYTLSYANQGPATVTNAVISDPIPSGTTVVSAPDGTVGGGLATWSVGSLAPGASGSVSLVVTANASAGSTIVNSGSALQATSAPTVQGPTLNTDIVTPLAVFSGTLVTDKSGYGVPEVVHQSASVTYVSGGAGLITGLTATLVTTNAAGAVMASASQPIDSISAGVTVPVTVDWNTSGAPTGSYTITFTVNDSAENVLVRRSLAVSVAAQDGARLTGTIAPANSPVPLGIALQTHLTIQNQNAIAYSALPLEVDLLDPTSLAIRKAIPLTLAVGANASAAADVSVPTTGLTTGDYVLWLTTSAGAGRLLATSSATIISPNLALSPASVTLVAGTSGTLTATLGSPLASAATLTLASSAPSIVSVPGSVPIAVGQISVSIPIQALGIGGPATITAALGASSATSQVTVIMSGSLTATLQVTQGETLTFGVTIANNGQTTLSNASFAVEIRNPSGGGLVDVVPFTATVAAGTSYTASLSYVTSTLAAQTYEARLVFNGTDPHSTLATTMFEVLVAAPLRLTASVGGPPRVLIWSSCSPGNSGAPCTPVAPPFLTATLHDAAIPYVVVGDENSFIAKMRTGSFSCGVIDQTNSAEPKIAPEYLADVHAGFGLLFIHSTANAMPKLAPALATDFLGTLHGPATLNVLATPFTVPGTLALNGDGVVIRLAGASAVATTSAGDPAMSYAVYGKGNVVVMPFDLEQTPTAGVAALILSSVRWISHAAGANANARDVVPLQFAVTTPPGGQVPITVTVTLPSSVTVVDALPALSTTTPITWSVLASGNSTTLFDLWVRLPSVIGTVTITVDAGNSGGPPVVTKTVDVTVTVDAGGLSSQLSSDLAALRSAALTNHDQKAIDDAIAQLARVTPSSDPLANVQQVLALIDDLLSVGINTTTARGDADRLLVYWQSRIGA